MLLKLDKDYIITESSKKLIEENNGTIIDPDFVLSHLSRLKIISVGDYTTEVLRRSGIIPWIEIVDLRTKRGEKTYNRVPGSITLDNPPGIITGSLIGEIKKAMERSSNTRIEVNGEEDLAVIPILFYADENTVVVYGVPDVGMAYIRPSEDSKKLIENIIKEMDVKRK